MKVKVSGAFSGRQGSASFAVEWRKGFGHLETSE